MNDNNNYDIIANEDYKSPLPIIPKGGGTVDWQAEYIKNLSDDVRHTRTEIENLRNELKADVSTTKQEIKQHIDSKIDSFLAEFRDRDNQRHKEMLAIQERIDTNTAGLRNEINATRRWIIGLVIAASASFVGITVSVGWGLFNVVNSLVNR